MGQKIFLCLFVIQVVIVQVIPMNLNPAIMQYLQLAGFGSPPPPRSLPVNIGKPAQASSMQALAALASLFAPTNVNTKPHATPQAISQAISSSNILAALSDSKLYNKSPPPLLSSAMSPESLYPPNQTNQPIDASLLNNLAIALQLLLVSNILNSPPQETTTETAVIPSYSTQENTTPEPVIQVPAAYAHALNQSPTNSPVSVKYAHTPNQNPITVTSLPSNPQPSAPSSVYYNPMSNYDVQPTSYAAVGPNANFVGASSFSDPLLSSVPYPSPVLSGRNGLALMSPYEALNPSASYSEPFSLSSYRSTTSRRDFQSPYSSFLGGDSKDLFSVSDFF